LIAERLRKLALRVPAIRPFFEAGRTLREALYLLRIYAAAFVWRPRRRPPMGLDIRPYQDVERKRSLDALFPPGLVLE